MRRILQKVLTGDHGYNCLSDAPNSTIKRDDVMIYVHGIVDTSVVQHKHKRTLLIIVSTHCINLNDTTTKHRLEVVYNQYR